MIPTPDTISPAARAELAARIAEAKAARGAKKKRPRYLDFVLAMKLDLEAAARYEDLAARAETPERKADMERSARESRESAEKNAAEVKRLLSGGRSA